MGVGLLAISLCLAAAPAEAAQPRIWLAPFAPITSPDGRRGAPDYFNLFPASAPWSTTASHVSVFKIYHGQLRAMSDDQVRIIIRGLAARHIDLAMEANVLVATSACGAGKAGPITADVARLKRLGADLRYLAMNEPLLSGHATRGPHDCQAPIQAVAADVAASLKPLLGLYPGLQIGDIEPVGSNADMAAWPSRVARWLDAYQAAMGRPLAFLHADVVWGRPWRDDLQRIAGESRKRSIPFGVIVDGDYSELSDASWTEDAAYYAGQVESVLGGSPAQVIFQSWENRPQATLPDTSTASMTGLVRSYLRRRTVLTRVGPGRFRLTDDTGAPIAHARIEVLDHDGSPGATLNPQTLAGDVPNRAESALFAARMNSDCPGCEVRAAEADIAGFEYREGDAAGRGEHDAFDWDPSAWAGVAPGVTRVEGGDGRPLLRLSIRADQALSLNGRHFPVRAGAPFQVRFQWRIEPPANDRDYVAVVFLDGDGREVTRVMRRFEVTWRRAAVVMSDASGLITTPAAARPRRNGGVPLALSYAGDNERRGARIEWRAP